MLINLFLSFFVEDNVIMTLRFAKKPIIPKIDWETIVIIGSFRKAAKTSVSLFVKSNSGFPVSVWRETFSILQYCHFSSMHLDLIQQSMNTSLDKVFKVHFSWHLKWKFSFSYFHFNFPTQMLHLSPFIQNSYKTIQVPSTHCYSGILPYCIVSISPLTLCSL